MGFSPQMRGMMKLLCVFMLALWAASGALCEECSRVNQRLQCGAFACDTNRGVCVPCNTSDECYPRAMECRAGKCVAKDLARGFSALSGVALLCAFAVCSIAVLAGVGGGGILVPMFCLLMEVPMDIAVGLSQATICGQSILNVFFAVQKRFPSSECSRPLINYQYLTLLIPLGVIGTLIGGVLNKLCPDLLRLILLFILLITVLYRTVRKLIAQYRKDQVVRREPIPVPSSEEEVAGTLHTPEGTPSLNQPQYPWLEILCVVSSFIVNLAFAAWRSRTKCGGGVYIVTYCIPIIANTVLFLWYRYRLAKMERCRLTFYWNVRTTILYPLVSVVAGIAAAMLGIGGGLVLGFVLYEVGLIPEEASVTGGAATLFLAFSSALSLLIEGRLLIDYAGVLFACGLLSAALGNFVFMRLIKKYKLRFLIVAALAMIIAGSLAFLSGFGIYNSLNLVNHGGSILAFGRVCRSSHHRGE
ncbi:hypothetical protein TraAM80_09180 [Trypanosoma rangeli]|uniref:Sulfite exporter TauE/SafE n=1 Tax=Trypanosoma rangeli TaxID=5698 RepID=A0A3R7KMV5_TRYRA|nr:uncharacterized protein TraAM80_09180 [Trypanosoma rangeli]RNE97696.1 hypothetical protein TraAM80_09180 [Trypanosoma rangeli]|eukprot:RNE97696.1 hypothetical protein TraAM80_09180 [Trypanosoma rangeli]